MDGNGEINIVEDNINSLIVVHDALPDNGVELIIQDNRTNDIITTIQDHPSNNVDVHDVFEEDIFVVQDAPIQESDVIAVFTQEQDKTLLDAGPVFKGPPGPSNYDLWIAAGHTGSVEDFFATLHGGKGDSGPPGVVRSFTYIQNQASRIWIIYHGLEKYPEVVLIDGAGDRFEGDLGYPDQNTVIVTLIAPTTGTAVLQ